ncbi:hypothetical protein QFC20_000820 [Naganishia adeliensis]|uniref:Uncharacterized protein n=1 Tax=Naganishia adeliensis TaxID=92952 RepID=A0ACC2WZA2_9TREE|nr:hypothetical protein QFC20_000820 [Naganishia adeliensis]
MTSADRSRASMQPTYKSQIGRNEVAYDNFRAAAGQTVKLGEVDAVLPAQSFWRDSTYDDQTSSSKTSTGGKDLFEYRTMQRSPKISECLSIDDCTSYRFQPPDDQSRIQFFVKGDAKE